MLIQTEVWQYSSPLNKATSEEEEQKGEKGRVGGLLGMKDGEEKRTAQSKQERGKLR